VGCPFDRRPGKKKKEKKGSLLATQHKTEKEKGERKKEGRWVGLSRPSGKGTLGDKGTQKEKKRLI